ncbi:MAG TPA: acyl-CoA dehydrogenase family protein [Pseudonocardiaceae bacterium]|jgi:alkylation response protein AidB-like acyl-CoA dehydrogenase|nr:acyl-CoA dehydrogenase family protein [Pseudonocardiaceae bacterium]
MASATLTAAQEIAPRLSARAEEGERLATMPSDLVADARAAGLFGLATPRVLGGAELPPATIIDIAAELSRADGSAGWTIMIGNSTAFLAWLDPSVAAELVGERTDVVSSAVFAPNGQLTPDGDGFKLSGRWPFSSGSVHSDWFINGAVVTDGDSTPRTFTDGRPDWRLSVVPASGVEVVDNWDVAGLRGTGSHDVTASGVAVPREHTMIPFFEPARHDGPLWRLPFLTLVGVILAGVPVGIARRALDEFTGFAPTKIRPPSTDPIAMDGDVQMALTRAEGGLQSALAFVHDTVGALWDTACLGDVPDLERRARFLLATQQAMRASVEAVDTAFSFAGASALHSSHPMQRCFRDIHAADQHVYFATAAAKRYAKTRFGIDQPTFWL